MIRMISFLLFFMAIGLVGVWMKQNDFTIEAEVSNYLVETSAVRLVILFSFFLLAFFGIIKLFLWIKNSPKRISQRLEKNSQEQGYSDLMKGFSALAAGEVDYAKKLSTRAEKALKNQPLVKLLQAQTAVVGGEPAKAEEYYSALAKNDNSRIVGYRGLIAQAIENQEMDRALELAEDLLKLNPRSKWINRAVVDLSFRNEKWEKAEEYTERAAKNGSINRLEKKINMAIVNYLYARDDYKQAHYDKAIVKLNASIRLHPKFLPAMLLLTEIYIADENPKQAAKQIEKFWKSFPHPQFAAQYNEIHKDLDSDKVLKKILKLKKANPKSLQSYIIYAESLIRNGEKAKAQKELEAACKIRETRKVCELMKVVDNSIDWATRATNAEDDKCWYCMQTGAKYPSWQVFGNNGDFNTIIWDYPPTDTKYENQLGNFLLIK